MCENKLQAIYRYHHYKKAFGFDRFWSNLSGWNAGGGILGEGWNFFRC